MKRFVSATSGHSASGIHVNARGETSVKGLYAAGDCASVPHNYMLGAFVYGKLCGENAAAYCAETGLATVDADAQAREGEPNLDALLVAGETWVVE